MNHCISYLALGDSYTIGESVPLHESFPYLTAQLIRKQKMAIHAPEIIAKTGWTSSELAEQILKTELNTHYDYVSLLIGVNNQYRHQSLNEFRSDFEYLLKKSIHLTNGKPQNVIVLSIPDWGCTPFAKEKNPGSIAVEIDSFNHVCAQFAEDYHTQYIDITTATRAVSNQPSALAADQLHYSRETHLLWANLVANKIMELC
ncbi:SGNH/GDSL hydrolase family protein [Sediminibacterium sp.]|uniref:SGNH/GDSL hydrolase family protein n=1 Tax=Sediminibacterium sp. TaxID=1917865 RepID=UPI003F718FC0